MLGAAIGRDAVRRRRSTVVLEFATSGRDRQKQEGSSNARACPKGWTCWRITHFACNLNSAARPRVSKTRHGTGKGRHCPLVVNAIRVTNMQDIMSRQRNTPS